jgi:uncharacterized membrane protein
MGLLNVPHLHLLLNHVPTTGTVIALGVFLLALIRRSDHLRIASLELFFVIGVLTVPVYLSGVVAESSLKGNPGVSAPMIRAHQDAALLGFVLVMLTALAAWVSLWQFRRRARAARSMSLAALLLAVLSIVLMARAATLGGNIRHPEIRVDQSSPVKAPPPLPGTRWLTRYSLTALVDGTPQVWAICETLHFLGLSLSLGVLLVVNLRLLGFMKAVPFSAVHWLLPWGLLGFGLNLVTGMVFFISASDRYAGNRAFAYKIAFMMVAGANFLYLTVFDKTWALESGSDARVADKALAVLSIVLWLGMIYWGRILPFWPLEN